MKSFFRYPGGKSKLSKIILPELHCILGYDQYREPFFGGGSIGLSMIERLADGQTGWINDRDIGIACLWQSVRDQPDKLMEMVTQYTPEVKDFYGFKEYFLSIPDPKTNDEILLTGFRKLAIHQLTFSGLGVKSGGPLGGSKQTSKYPIDCRWSPKSICSKIEKMKGRFHDVVITNADFEELILDESETALLYLDPPYYDKGGELYHHAFTHDDHVRLRDALAKTPHDWVLSYDDVPEIRALYDDVATVIEIDANYSINTSTKKIELLIFKQDYEPLISKLQSDGLILDGITA